MNSSVLDQLTNINSAIKSASSVSRETLYNCDCSKWDFKKLQLSVLGKIGIEPTFCILLPPSY